jgi:dTDP-4-dehydrorhamnose reductase
MLKLMKSRDSIGVVADQWGTPTWTRDLATAIQRIVTQPKPIWGTFHFSGGGMTNWHAFAVEIYRLGKLNGLLDRTVTINALTTDQYPTKTTRPAWSVLDKTKIISAYGVSVTPWEDNLSRFMGSIVSRKFDPAISRFWSN